MTRSRLTPSTWRRTLGLWLAILDAAVIAASSAGAYLLRQRLGSVGVLGELQDEIPAALAVLPLWLLVLYWSGCYRPEYQNQTAESVRRFVAGTVGGVLILGFASFLFRLELARLYVAFLFVLVLVGGLLARWAVRRWLVRKRRGGGLIQRVLAVGAREEETLDLIRAMSAEAANGYEVVGFIDDELGRGVAIDDGYVVLGHLGELLEIAERHAVGLVVVSPGATSSKTLQDIMIELEGSPIDLAIAPSLFQVVSRRVTVESVANVPILHVDQIRLSRGRAAVKRFLDVLVCLLLGVATWPIMLAAAVAVKIHDGGPILFRQERVGKEQRRFELVKFRTMTPDAEEKLRHITDLNEAGHAFFKIREDPRVTRVGRFLRKWSIDELPQLWNVLRGEMAMVGPRPPLPREVERYEPWQLRRLRVRPGITGVWQVSGRSEVPFQEAVRMDLFYIENWSVGYDLFLLAKTVWAVLGRRGAY